MSYKLQATQNLPTMVLAQKDYDELISILGQMSNPQYDSGVYIGYLSAAGVFICKIK